VAEQGSIPALSLDGDAFYCGCWQQLGFYVFKPGMEKMPFRWASGLDSRRWQPRGASEGEAKVTHLSGWTILSFLDFSVDRRPGSHSTFALRGQHDYEHAISLARAAFPRVFERFAFEVSEAQEDG
jgi:hypothetical protein